MGESVTWDRGKSPAADRAERICNAALRAAEELASYGRPGSAEDVRRVCRSNRSYRTTCRQLYLDNVALRERIAELEARPTYADGFDEGRASESE
jgi:hypothetical protein